MQAKLHDPFEVIFNRNGSDQLAEGLAEVKVRSDSQIRHVIKQIIEAEPFHCGEGR